MNRGGFSWKRLLGISAAKSRISRKIRVPLTRSGRQRKLGAAAGCAALVVWIIVTMIAAVAAFAAITCTAVITPLVASAVTVPL